MMDQVPEEQRRWLAIHDPLTGCYNRRYTFNTIEDLLLRAQLRPFIFAISMIDVDKFKRINDIFGHLMGDAALKEIARLLKFAYPQQSTVIRFGGDEFVIISSEISRSKIVTQARRAKRLIKRIPSRTPYFSELSMSLSVGVSFYPKDGRTPEELLAAADKAMYEAKSLGGDRVNTA